MFSQARIKLTVWYIVIIMLISGFFSVAFYGVSTQELQRVVEKIERDQLEWESQLREPRPPKPGEPTVEELQASSERLISSLLIINGIILVISGGAAYFLAGKTLNPIKEMVDKQNEFVSNSSHELRTPLAVLRAEMEGNLLEKNISDKKARVLINSNLEEVSRLQKLANNLLKITKFHGFEPSKYSDSVSIKSIINSSVRQVNKLAKNKNIKIIEHIKDCKILGDENSLRELFVILLENAIKYSKEKTEIRINTQESGNKVEVKIKDQGIGISQDDLPYIFDRFYRSDKSRSEIEGFGLGLSIAKQIMNRHNGSIEIESKLKKGSTFILKFSALKP